MDGRSWHVTFSLVVDDFKLDKLLITPQGSLKTYFQDTELLKKPAKKQSQRDKPVRFKNSGCP